MPDRAKDRVKRGVAREGKQHALGRAASFHAGSGAHGAAQARCPPGASFLIPPYLGEAVGVRVMRGGRNGVGDGVKVAVGEMVGDGVQLGVGVRLGVGDGVGVGVAVGDAVGSGVFVGSGVVVGRGVDVGAGVPVSVGAGGSVGMAVAVGVLVSGMEVGLASGASNSASRPAGSVALRSRVGLKISVACSGDAVAVAEDT